MYLFQFHSKLTVDFFLLPTLYRNHMTRLHGFWQRCIVSWMFYLFRYCLTRLLTGSCVECRATASALVSTDFHSKLRITLYFFDVKYLIYKYLYTVTRCCSQNIAWISWSFFCAMLFWASGQLCIKIILCNTATGVLKQYCTGFYPNRIKVKLNRIFSYLMLLLAFWTTLYRILTCAMLSQE